MEPSTTVISPRERWTPRARRLGVASAIAILAIGVLYVATIILWLLLQATPREPIPDPYLAVMEVLTILSAAALVGVVLAIWCFADVHRSIPAMATLLFGTGAAVITAAVHFVQLSAVRELWRAGLVPDYRLVWPSALFAAEYFAWDILVGLTLICASFAVAGARRGERAPGVLRIAGTLCLVGAAGPFTGRMALQNVGLLGYAVGLPIAAVFVAREFRSTPPSSAAA
jgi:hypothetical protein